MLALDVVIMAAGKGTRMKSQRPKVLHRLGGLPLLARVLRTSHAIRPRRIVVVTGHEAPLVQEAARVACASMAMPRTQPRPEVFFALQSPQCGTGHAVQQAMPLLRGGLEEKSVALILSGDVPLIAAGTLGELVQVCAGEQLAILTATLANPAGYGRIVRDTAAHENSRILGIVEHREASADQLKIHEINTGIIAVPARHLQRWLDKLDNHNAQGEYYLTDIVAMAVAENVPVIGVQAHDAAEVAGVNSAAQLAELERSLQRRQAEALMEQGVRLADPLRLDVRGVLRCGQDVEIDVNCVFEGDVELGDNVQVGAHCCIANAKIASGSVIHPYTHIDGQAKGLTVGENARIGPFARLRPGTHLGAEVHIGNFVEVKNSTLADGAKANHLAYLGDATVGECVNYGAGSITANYDGTDKHQTVIEADVLVGSNCVLVAPVEIGAGGTIGAGSTITRNTPPGALTVARNRQQVSLANWPRPRRKC